MKKIKYESFFQKNTKKCLSLRLENFIPGSIRKSVFWKNGGVLLTGFGLESSIPRNTTRMFFKKNVRNFFRVAFFLFLEPGLTSDPGSSRYN